MPLVVDVHRALDGLAGVGHEDRVTGVEFSAFANAAIQHVQLRQELHPPDIPGEVAKRRVINTKRDPVGQGAGVDGRELRREYLRKRAVIAQRGAVVAFKQAVGRAPQVPQPSDGAVGAMLSEDVGCLLAGERSTR